MSIKEFKELSKKKEQEFLSHVRQEYLGRTAPIELEEYKEMRMNSYEQVYLEPLYSNEVVVDIIENALKNIFNRPIDSNRRYLPITYDEFIMNNGIALLLKRFKELLNERG